MDEPFGRVGTTPEALGVDWRLRAKHFAVRSPLDSLVSRLQFARDRGRGRREPELDELHREGAALHACIRRELTARSNCVDVGAHIGSVLRHIERCAPRGIMSPSRLIRQRLHCWLVPFAASR